MKTIAKTLVVFFAFAASSAFASNSPAPIQTQLVHVLSTKRYLFHFKVEKELIGGAIEVQDTQGNVVLTENISQVKNIVDFFELRAGIYTIRIKKDALEFVYQYVNEE